uniref:protein EFFECTOR OF TRANSCRIPTION 2-like n=1 Tax=Erigeron canadensis TaxID=72917 RepID=UPI001CB93E52|nr:protein EFFECTOR OF TRANSCRIPTION 2-like [Erigeron canadensis]XP_043624569.1 protein EFFECTOR OF TRANSCRIPTION 2-like [Erigeron canadensis]
MVRMVNATAITTTSPPLLKRENCKHTKHDSVFSYWKILIGPNDWEDYLLNKEGVERYRTCNLPNCASCPGIYELGILVSPRRKEENASSKLSFKNVIPVYLGQADNVRTRMQQYGRDGDHLENGLSNGEQNDRKVLGLFSDIFAYGFAIAFRWAPMDSKKDAEIAESQLLKTFDYAWNRGMNGERRPGDIHQKLSNAASHTKRVHLIFKKLHAFPPKKVGLKIKRCDSPVFENGSNFYTNQKDTNILSRIFKFSRFRPTLVSKESFMNNNDVDICGVALGHGSICTRAPVEGRKRCMDHKGMKVNAFVKPHLPTNNTEITPHLTCGVTLDDASFCTRVPVVGRKRCEEHKGMRIIRKDKHYIPSSGLDLESGRFRNEQKSCEENIMGMMVNGNKSKISSTDLLTCAAITVSGSLCKRKPGQNSKFCWQHEAMRGHEQSLAI